MNNPLLCFKIGFVALLLFAMPFAHYAQDSRVVVQNATYSTNEKPVVLVKWYSKDLIYDEGVNVYRRVSSASTWEKINAQPVKQKQSISPLLLQADPDMSALVDLLKSVTPQERSEGIVVFNLLLKSFQSSVFADFMGIYFEDASVASGRRYEYKVNKIKNGKEYLLATSAVIEPGKYVADAPIENVEAFQKNKTLNLNWTHDENRFYAVNVYRTSSDDGVTVKLNKMPLMLSKVTDSLGRFVYPKPMFSEDIKLKEGNSYTYQLAGVGFFGNETQLSQPVRVAFRDITPPPAPKNLTVKADSMKVYLNWENVAVDDLLGMFVYRGRRSDGPFEVVNAVPLGLGMIQYVDSLSLPGPYYYFIAAQDQVKNEAHSNLAFAQVQDVIPPAAPTQLVIKADTGKINLSWKRNEETDLAGYYLYRTVDKNEKGNYMLLNSKPLPDNQFEQRLPKNVKNEFFYYVVAVDTSYNRSKPSAYVSAAMPDVIAPEKPFIKTVTYADQAIVIEWIPNVDADLASYDIYRADTSRIFSRRNINPLDKKVFRYTDRDNAPNMDYYYYTVAVDSAGNQSLPSKEMYARRVVKDSAPVEKIDLKIKHNKNKKHIQLTWQYETDASVLGYVVYRGEEQNKLQPISGLIKTHTFIDKMNENRKETRELFYQVRVYVAGEVGYSPVVKEKW